MKYPTENDNFTDKKSRKIGFFFNKRMLQISYNFSIKFAKSISLDLQFCIQGTENHVQGAMLNAPVHSMNTETSQASNEFGKREISSICFYE